MNDYEAKKQARADRYRERASKLRKAAAAAHGDARGMLDVIPPGQPILVGHHSERRHRRDLERIDKRLRKAREAEEQAASLERRAAAAEDSHAISSDDPDAPAKLRDRIAELEATRERMKAANRVVRRRASETERIAALAELGYGEAVAKGLLEPDCFGQAGYSPYMLSNLSGNIRRLKKRLAHLERQREQGDREPVTIGDVEICEEDNRVRLIFPSKPDAMYRAELKRSGFRWSPRAGAWQRMSTDTAWREAKRIATMCGGGEASQ